MELSEIPAAPANDTRAVSGEHTLLSQHYDGGFNLVTTNVPFYEWNEVFGSKRLTAALLDRLTHQVYILETNSESYRFKRSRENVATEGPDD